MGNWGDDWLRACAVCGYMLIRVTQGGQQTYTHKAGDGLDHPAVPVGITEIHTIIRCDFCSAEGAIWTLPVEDYSIDGVAINRGDWAVCTACAALLERDAWNALVSRAHLAHKARHVAVPREAYAAMYRQLRAHITGSLHLETRPGLAGPPEGTQSH